MRTLYYFTCILLFQCSAGQSGIVPKCLEEKLSKNKNMVLIDSLKLPNNEMVYRTGLNRPKQCIDCLAGTIYFNKDCTIVAKYTIGRAVNKTIEDGYLEEWFDFDASKPSKENKNDSTKINSSSTVKMFENFKSPKIFKIQTIHQSRNILKLKKGDKIEISNEKGLIVYRNQKKINQFKLEPKTENFKMIARCVKAPCPTLSSQYEFYQWDHYGIMINSSLELLIYDFNNSEKNALSGWNTLANLTPL